MKTVLLLDKNENIIVYSTAKRMSDKILNSGYVICFEFILESTRKAKNNFQPAIFKFKFHALMAKKCGMGIDFS